MKQFLMFVVVMSLVIAVGAVAQTNEKSKTPKDKSEAKPATVEPTATPAPEASKTPRVYPIAAGLWYPGQPLPEKPFRYYRIRCWPGCHSYGKYADPPKAKKPESESQTAPTAPTDKK